MPAKPKDLKLVYVEWEDSFGCSSNWEVITENVNAKPLICRSVGWLVQDDKRCKVIVPHVAPEHASAERQGCGDMTIPTRSIVRMVHLKIPRLK